MLSVLIESASRSLLLAAAVWFALKLLRARNPHAGQILWRLVLLAALLMPALMQWKMLALPAPTPELLSIVRLDTTPAAPSNQFDWQAAALCVYFSVAVLLCLRQLFGFVRMRRIHRAALIVRETWTSGADVRTSAALRAPVTFGSTILLPNDYATWSAAKRTAVMEHERMHIANRDFGFQVLAHAYRAIFWFSPLAWWLPRQLNLLGEQLSDDAAIRAIRDRTSYAEILLEVAGNSHDSSAAVAMARPATLIRRIERIVSDNELPANLGVIRRTGLAAALIPVVFGVASCSADKGEPVQQSANLQATPTESATPSATTEDAVEEPVVPANTQLPKSNSLYPLSWPQYPPASRQSGQHGTVVLQLYVLEDGSVENVKIKKSSSFARLDYAAANESLNWRLDPGTVDGKPKPMWGSFAVTFKLRD